MDDNQQILPHELWVVISKKLLEETGSISELFNVCIINKATLNSLWNEEDSSFWHEVLTHYLQPAFIQGNEKSASLSSILARLHERCSWKSLFIILVRFGANYAGSLVKSIRNDDWGMLADVQLLEGFEDCALGEFEAGKLKWIAMCIAALKRAGIDAALAIANGEEEGEDEAPIPPIDRPLLTAVVSFLADIAVDSKAVCRALYDDYHEWNIYLWDPSISWNVYDQEWEMSSRVIPFYTHAARLRGMIYMEHLYPGSMGTGTQLLLPPHRWDRRHLDMDQLIPFLQANWSGMWSLSPISRVKEWNMHWDSVTLKDLEIGDRKIDERKKNKKIIYDISGLAVVHPTTSVGICDLVGSIRYNTTKRRVSFNVLAMASRGHIECRGYVDGDGAIGRFQLFDAKFGSFILRPVK